MKTYCKLLSIYALLLFLSPLFAQTPAPPTGSISGYCEQGNQAVVTPGSQNSTTRIQRSYPSCTVNVYYTGTTTRIPLFSDIAGTVKANPFTANTTGFYSFFAASGTFDINLSGAGISAPFTIPAARISPTISVRDFGATGNGTTDDTASIGRTMTAACAAAPAKVIFPPGTYSVKLPSVSFNPIIPVCSNLEVEGPGTVKIANNAGAYYEIFGTTGADLANFQIHNITIDENSANNPIANLTEINTYVRIAVHARGEGAAGNNVTVDHVHVANARAIWVLYFSGTNAQATNNLIDNFGGGAIDTDTSLIYTSDKAANAIITGNQILGYTPNGAMVRTAIETHSTVTVANNKMDGFLTGMNLTGIAATTVDGVSSTGNIISDGFLGIHIWSSNSLGATTCGIKNVNVIGNQISIRSQFFTNQAGAGSGILLDYLANLPFCDININGNQVDYTLSASNTDHVAGTDLGIGYSDLTAGRNNPCNNCNFSNNTIINAPAIAVLFNATGSNVSFDNETIINPGSSLNPAIGGGRAGMAIGNPTAITGVTSVKGGTIVDNLTPSRTALGAVFGSGSIIVDGLSISCADPVCASLTSVFFINSTGTSIRATVNVPAAKVFPVNPPMSQSSILSLQENLTYIWSGTFWGTRPLLTPHTVTPVPSACGAGPTIIAGSNDRVGGVQIGTGVVHTCRITWGTAFSATPLGTATLAFSGTASNLRYSQNSTFMDLGSLDGVTDFSGAIVYWSFPLAQ